MIQEGEAITIGSGTTVMALAKAIPNNFKLTVLTGAMNVTVALKDHEVLIAQSSSSRLKFRRRI